MTIIGNCRLAIVRVSTISSLVVATISQSSAFLNDIPHPYAAYGPHPYLFVSFIVAQTVLQAYWLRQLFPYEGQAPASTQILSDNEGDSGREAGAILDVDDTQLAYTSTFVFGNICLSIWSYFLMKEKYGPCQVTLIFNTCNHLCAAYSLLHPLHNAPQANKITVTLLLSKTSVGLAILYMWKTWGIVDKTTAPSLSGQLQLVVFFLLLTLASGPDPTLGICLISGLIAMILGLHQAVEWRMAFVYMIPSIVVVMIVDYYLDARRRTGLVQGAPSVDLLYQIQEPSPTDIYDEPEEM
ncbi:hypothetical protein AX15_000688 [Amanita polypyramis BW_CC]|nr:hypothetical protein AX15_000688 [Amanita polypyramis BW_CC]